MTSQDNKVNYTKLLCYRDWRFTDQSSLVSRVKHLSSVSKRSPATAQTLRNAPQYLSMILHTRKLSNCHFTIAYSVFNMLTIKLF